MANLLGHAFVRSHHFAVVGGVDNKGALCLSGLSENIEQALELPVDAADAAVVATLRGAQGTLALKLGRGSPLIVSSLRPSRSISARCRSKPRLQVDDRVDGKHF